jgi:hypothetical protein
MASPNLSEIVTTTLRNRSKKLNDNMTRNNVILSKMSEKNRIDPFSGGRTIVQELSYANNTTYRRYSGYEVLNIQPSDVFSAAEYPIRQAAVAISISGLEMLQNTGENAIINLLKSRIENAEATAENGMSYDMFSDGSISGQMLGLQALISTSPTSGTIGGIDRASWTFWQNQKYSAVSDGGAAITSANIQRYMNTLAMRLIRGVDGPDMILADNTAYQTYLESLTAIQRITKAGDAVGGFTSLAYNSVGREIPVYLAGGFQGTTTDGNTFSSTGGGAVGGPPSSTMYFVNSRYLSYRPHRERNWVPLDPDRFSVNQDAMVKLIGWAGNMTLSNAFLQGVLTT